MNSYREIKQATADVVDVRVITRTNTERAHAAIRDVILANPLLTYTEIAALLGCSHWLVYTTAGKFGVRRPRGGGSPTRHGSKKRRGRD